MKNPKYNEYIVSALYLSNKVVCEYANKLIKYAEAYANKPIKYAEHTVPM